MLQSEHGAWFLRKQNRNIVVETDEDVPAAEDFCWLTLGQLVGLLRTDNLVNMNTRTVLSCLPFGGPATGPGAVSTDPVTGRQLNMLDLYSWFTEAKSRHATRRHDIGLNDVEGWRREEGEIRHGKGRFFRVVGVRTEAGSREVTRWDQPLIAPAGQGLAAFVVRKFAGVPHVLVHARPEAGLPDVVELAPTVQCTPADHTGPNARSPRFLRNVLAALPAQRRYDTVMSEEGGRFYHAEVRYMIVEADDDVPRVPPEDYRWVTLQQLTLLLRHSRYVNIQARTLVTCWKALT